MVQLRSNAFLFEGREAAITGIKEQSVTGEELYRRFLLGDAAAFEEIVASYEGELSIFISNIVRDYHEAKHLTIEAFAQLAVNGKRFAGKSSIKTYLFTIGKNLASRYIKMRGSEQHLSFEDVIETLADTDETPDSFMERDENKRQLHEAMKELKDDHRIVLILLYFEDMSYIQAGRAMKKSEKQIKHLAYRAKAALKIKLESNGFINVG